MPRREAPDASDGLASRSGCSGVILAGGANTRFEGRPKGLELVGGRTILERVAVALRGASDDLLLVANDSSAHTWLADVPVVSDVRGERGSLVGVHTALTRARRAVLVVAWDMPFVSTELLVALRHEGDAIDGAVVPVGPRGLEPLCAYYPAGAVDVATRLLDAGEMRLSAFVEALPRVKRLETSRLAAFGDPSRMFVNVNDAASLARARALVGRADEQRR